jgi:beta-glucosidase
VKTVSKSLLASMVSLVLMGCGPNQNSEEQAMSVASGIEIWPKLDIEVKSDANLEQRVAALLAEMTLEQKIAQMIQPEIRDVTVEDMRKYGFGSYLNGGGAFPNNNKHATPANWIQLAEDMYQASIDDSLDGSRIPTMWGTDAVHGHNNVIGATLFPHNIGLGAANNPALIEKIANITATEVMVTGIDWVFAPTVATVRDDRWGRTYESYSEDPAIVKSYSEAIVKGLQGHANADFLDDDRVISTVKHFVGDGGTVDGVDQGNNIASEQELFAIHTQGYVGGLSAGAQSVMASFNSWHGEKLHGHKYLLTDVLKDRMGFDGFVVGDWNGHGQVANCSNTSCAQAINAGLDIFMVPSDWKGLYENTLQQARDGTIPIARINDAVTRILRVKMRAGLFEKPSPAQRKFSGKVELIGAKAHREVARQAVRESLVLLKNKDRLLPLNPKQRVLVAGDTADNIGKQSGGWTITWQGTNNTNADFPGGSSIWDGINQEVMAAGGKAVLSVNGEFEQKPDVAIVVFGEEPYAEGQGDRESLIYQPQSKTDLALLRKFKSAGIPVVSVFISGRPMWVNAELNASDAFVAAWLPGSEGEGVAEVLFTDADGQIKHDFTGKLSFSWPKSAKQIVNIGDDNYQPLLPFGFGLSYADENTLADDLAETSGDVLLGSTSIRLFSGAPEKPLQLELFSGDTSMIANANTHILSAISYRTIDKVVQEDARRLVFTGTQTAGMRLVSEQTLPQLFKDNISQEMSLSLSVMVNEKPTAEVLVNLGCNDCSGAIDLTPYLADLSLGEWHQLSFPLAKFDKELSDVNARVAFELKTKGRLDMAFANIYLERDAK